MDPNHLTSPLVSPLISAAAILAEWEEDEQHTWELAMQSLANLDRALKDTQERIVVLRKAEALIKFLKSVDVDYTLLLYLQTPCAKGFISYLEGMCEQHDLHKHPRRLLLDVVWAHFVREGVQPITPSRFIVSRKKDDILREYEGIRSRKEWGQHNAFFFQTFITVKGEGFRKLVFFITRTWQDGVIRLHDILSHGCFVHGTSVFDAHGAFEHAIDDEALTTLILDSEIMASAFKGVSAEDLKRELLQFPCVLSAELVERGLLQEEAVLSVVVKDKTRPRGGSVKVSYHFVLCVCAEKGVHKQCIEMCYGAHKEAIVGGLEHLKAHGALPETRLHTSWYAFDAKAAISNGFTTAFSLKERSDPHSRKHAELLVCAGAVCKEELCPIAVQDLAGGTAAERLWLLQEQLYTTPKRIMLSYACRLEAKVCLVYCLVYFFDLHCLFAAAPGLEPVTPRPAAGKKGGG